MSMLAARRWRRRTASSSRRHSIRVRPPSPRAAAASPPHEAALARTHPQTAALKDWPQQPPVPRSAPEAALTRQRRLAPPAPAPQLPAPVGATWRPAVSTTHGVTESHCTVRVKPPRPASESNYHTELWSRLSPQQRPPDSTREHRPDQRSRAVQRHGSDSPETQETPASRVAPSVQRRRAPPTAPGGLSDLPVVPPGGGGGGGGGGGIDCRPATTLAWCPPTAEPSQLHSRSVGRRRGRGGRLGRSPACCNSARRRGAVRRPGAAPESDSPRSPSPRPEVR